MEIAIVMPNRSECGRHVQTDRLVGFFGECGEGSCCARRSKWPNRGTEVATAFSRSDRWLTSRYAISHKTGLSPAGLERYIHRRLRLLVVEHPNAIHSASVSGSSAKLCSPRQRPVQSRAPRGATSDTKLLEIELRQLRQDIGVDVTRSKERLVLSEPETSEPTPDILERQPSRRRRRSGGPHGRIRSAGLAAGRRGHTPQALL